MAERDEMTTMFTSVAPCDVQAAIFHLEASGWNLDAAISNFMEGDSQPNAALPGNSDVGGGMMPPEERAPIPQFRDTLIDPALHVPQRMTQPQTHHPLEAFRDFQSEGVAAGTSKKESEVFGLTKRPKNLAEIYKAPTDLCFVGTFEELRAAGQEQGKWLLINIQSPIEFGSQRLNADTWSDETLRAIINARCRGSPSA